jgi:hypothetical protein
LWRAYARCWRCSLQQAKIQQVWISCHIFPDDEGIGTMQTPSMFDMTEHNVQRVRQHWRHISKRAIDIAGSLMAIVLLSPALLLIGGLVKVTSKGPVLFPPETCRACGPGVYVSEIQVDVRE